MNLPPSRRWKHATYGKSILVDTTNRFETEVKTTRLNPINQRREPYVSGKQKVRCDFNSS